MKIFESLLGGLVLVSLSVARAPRVSAQQDGGVPPEGEPEVTAGKDGFSIRTSDETFVLRFLGYLQTDGRFFFDHGASVNDNFLIRRARPIIEATVWRYFGFRLMPDFGNTSPAIFDAYSETRLSPAFIIRVGKFKPPIGLERLQSATDIPFAERGLPTNLVPSRDIGFQLGGERSRWGVAYQVGVFNGVPDLANGGDDPSAAKDFAARLFVLPIRRGAWRGLGVGLAGSTGLERASPAAPNLAAYRTPGQQIFFRYRSDPTNPANTAFANGRRARLSPQGYFYGGPFGLLGEFVSSRQAVTRGTAAATLDHTAWQVSASFFLTGEAAGFRNPAPKKPFDPGAVGYGALEFVARYGRLDIDDEAFPVFADPASSARTVKAWGVGLNWHLVRAVKLALDYEHSTFVGGAAGGNRAPEDVVIVRVQQAF